MTSGTTWFHRAHGKDQAPLVAYFSAEFGLTESLSIFAGGLGLLAGDHLKSASDLGVPLVGVGLLYQQGYFRQQLSESGWQQEAREDNDFYNLPLTLERDGNGKALSVEVQFPGRPLKAQVWRVQVGRVALYLLDTNIPENQPDDRRVTNQLYGGDLEVRLKQEILLGIGGYRALDLLGLTPTVYHMNEGHSAFLALERLRQLMQNQQAHVCPGARGCLRQPDLHVAYAGPCRARLLPAGSFRPLPWRLRAWPWADSSPVAGPRSDQPGER